MTADSDAWLIPATQSGSLASRSPDVSGRELAEPGRSVPLSLTGLVVS